jgi:hypothetical protein
LGNMEIIGTGKVNLSYDKTPDNSMNILILNRDWEEEGGGAASQLKQTGTKKLAGLPSKRVGVARCGKVWHGKATRGAGGWLRCNNPASATSCVIGHEGGRNCK